MSSIEEGEVFDRVATTCGRSMNGRQTVDDDLDFDINQLLIDT